MEDIIDDLGSSSEDGIEVELPSGSTWHVWNEKEREYVMDKSRIYQEHNKFSNISDLQDLDRVIQLETLIYRWNQWTSLEKDYDGDKALDPRLQDNILKSMKEVRELKKNIGIDKASRDKERGESVAQYIENLLDRAKEFGVMRNKQAEKAITLWREAQALITLHDNCTDDERKQNGCTTDDVLDWFRRVIPEFNSIDEEFRSTSQKYWIKEQ